jgi:DNA-binding NarL/FixJ family response regulator
MPGTRIIIVDDHPLFRGALKQALTGALDAPEILEAGSLDELSEMLARDSSVDLVLLDLTMPGVQGLPGLLFLRTQFPEVPVVIVSASEDPGTIRGAVGFGALGFVPKSQPVDRIRAAIRAVLDGELWVPADVDLSAPNDRTAELVGRLSTLTPQQVRVNVSEATIKAHVSAILQKLGVDSRTQAVIAINRIDSGDWQKIAS